MQSTSLIAAVSALAVGASAKTLRIDVGLTGLTFTPNTLVADVGDVLEFHYHPKNHSVAASDFANPCQPAAKGGFFSGYQPVASGEGPNVFQVTVENTNPIWFYCTQNVASHCKNGMSGVVNQKPGNKTLEAYQLAAKSVAEAGHAPAPFGGKLISASTNGTTTSAAPATASTTNASPTASTTIASPPSSTTGGSDSGSGSGSGSPSGSPSGSGSGSESSSTPVPGAAGTIQASVAAVAFVGLASLFFM